MSQQSAVRLRWLGDLLKSVGLLVSILVILLLSVAMVTGIGLKELALVIQATASNNDKVARIIISCVPLWLTALAFSIPLKVGFFNVGADGQLALGTLAAAIGLLVAPIFVPLTTATNVVILGLLVPLMAGVVGASWIGLALLLRRRFGVHEVVSTLLLNFVSFGLIGVSLQLVPGLGDWTGGSQGLKTVAFEESMVDFGLLLEFRGANVTVYTIYAFGILAVTHWGLWSTHPGLRLRATGLSKQVAEFAGINVRKITCWGAFAGGCFAGLAGLNQLLSAGRFDLAHYQTIGFEGIAVSLLGRHRFSGILIVAMMLSFWRHLTNDLQRLGMPAQLYWVGQGLAMIGFLCLVRRSGE